MVMSATVDAYLMLAKSWQPSEPKFYDSIFLNGKFSGGLEGNFVVDKNIQLWDILRVDDKSSIEEKAAMISLSGDGKKSSFDPATGFIHFDGDNKKFVIKYDSTSGQYWTLANSILERFRKQYPTGNSASFRNTLMLRKSKDLIQGEDVKIILERKDVLNHGFQYVDWLIDGNDMIVLSLPFELSTRSTLFRRPFVQLPFVLQLYPCFSV
jgi:hypothetical protein